MRRFIDWLGIAAIKFHDWKARYGSANEHNATVPRDWWLEPWEKAAILRFHDGHPLEGYRRLAFMMLDADVVAVSPSSVYRVLRGAGLMKAAEEKVAGTVRRTCSSLTAGIHLHDKSSRSFACPVLRLTIDRSSAVAANGTGLSGGDYVPKVP